MTPEGKIKDAVKKILRANGVLWFMPVQQGYGAPSLDFLCWTKNGYPFAVETKADWRSPPTPRQYATAMEFIAHGVPAYLIRAEFARTTGVGRVRESVECLASDIQAAALSSHSDWVCRTLKSTKHVWDAAVKASQKPHLNPEGDE